MFVNAMTGGPMGQSADTSAGKTATSGPNVNLQNADDLKAFYEYLLEKERESAEKQMQYQTQSAERAMSFEAQQAQINRDFQERMSSTSYQRAIEDLKRSGLSPLLAVGAQAPMASGASASGVAQSGSKAQQVVGNPFEKVLDAQIASARNNTSIITSLVNLFGKLFGKK